MLEKLRRVATITTVITLILIGNVGVADEPRSLNERGVKELVKGLKILEQAVAHLNDSYELKKTDLAAYNLGRSMLHASQPCEAAKVFMQVLDFSLEHEGGSKLSRLELAKRAWESLAQIPAGCNSGE